MFFLRSCGRTSGMFLQPCASCSGTRGWGISSRNDPGARPRRPRLRPEAPSRAPWSCSDAATLQPTTRSRSSSFALDLCSPRSPCRVQPVAHQMPQDLAQRWSQRSHGCRNHPTALFAANVQNARTPSRKLSFPRGLLVCYRPLGSAPPGQGSRFCKSLRAPPLRPRRLRQPRTRSLD